MTDGISSGTVEVNCGDLVDPALGWSLAKAGEAEGVFFRLTAKARPQDGGSVRRLSRHRFRTPVEVVSAPTELVENK
jgi:hypothetical protein